MTSPQQITNVLTQSEIDSILALPEVVAAKERLDASQGAHAMVYLNLALPAPIREAIQSRLGVDLSAVATVPLRWIKGDSLPHVDRALTGGAFENTYLMYLTDSPGQLVLGDATYPIEQNTAYRFQEGVNHETVGAAGTSRLLVGPMNETGLAVGSPVGYFPTLADALAYTNPIAFGGGYTVETQGGFSSWRIAPNSTGSSSQAVTYATGQTLINDGVYYLYPGYPCFLKGSKILCEVDGKEEWRAVETLRKGDLVKTSLNGFKPVELIGYSKMKNPGTSDRVDERLYRLTPAAYPALTEDLFLTGFHSILVDELTDAQRTATQKSLGKIFVTDRKYRLMAWVDERAEPWASEGEYEVWHFALENADTFMNYGVYANGGLLVESCNIRFLRDKSNMTLLS
jgi:hypothetical protein